MKKENKSIDLKKSLDNFKKDAERQGYVDNFAFIAFFMSSLTLSNKSILLYLKIKDYGKEN